MDKPWKEIQDLVAYLERELAEIGVIVTSPDWIWDDYAKKEREVDISLKKVIDNETILIIFEVRDWAKVQDVTWIEQLVTKKNHLKANHLIAVTTTDFSKGARSAAINSDIELRRISEVSREEIRMWFGLKEFIIESPDITFYQTQFVLPKGSIRGKLPKMKDFTLRDKNTEKTLQLEEIKALIHTHPEFCRNINSLVPNAPKKRMELLLDLKEKGRYRYEKFVKKKYIDIDAIKVNIEAQLQQIKIPAKLKRKYFRRTEDPQYSTVLAEISEFEGLFLGKEILFRAYNFPTIKKSRVDVIYDNPDLVIYDAKLNVSYRDQTNIEKTMQFLPEKH